MTLLPVPELRAVALALLLAGATAAHAELECHQDAATENEAGRERIELLSQEWSEERVRLLMQPDTESAQAAYEKRLHSRLGAELAAYRQRYPGEEALSRLFELQQTLRVLFASPWLATDPFYPASVELPAWAEQELADFLRGYSRPAGKPKQLSPATDTYDNTECRLLQDLAQGINLMALPGLDPLTVPRPVTHAPNHVVYRVPSTGMAAADGAYRLAHQGGREVQVTLGLPFRAPIDSNSTSNDGESTPYVPLDLAVDMPVYAVSGTHLAAGTLRRVHPGGACDGWVEVVFTAPLTQPLLGLLVVGSGTQPTLAQLRHLPLLRAPLIDRWEERTSEVYRNLSSSSGVDMDDDGVTDLRFVSRRLETRERRNDGSLSEWETPEGFAATVRLLRHGQQPARPYGEDSGTRFGNNVFVDCPE